MQTWGFAEVLGWKTVDPGLPAYEKTLSTDVDTKKKQEAALKRNRTAIAAFILAF